MHNFSKKMSSPSVRATTESEQANDRCNNGFGKKCSISFLPHARDTRIGKTQGGDDGVQYYIMTTTGKLYFRIYYTYVYIFRPAIPRYDEEKLFKLRLCDNSKLVGYFKVQDPETFPPPPSSSSPLLIILLLLLLLIFFRQFHFHSFSFFSLCLNLDDFSGDRFKM